MFDCVCVCVCVYMDVVVDKKKQECLANGRCNTIRAAPSPTWISPSPSRSAEGRSTIFSTSLFLVCSLLPWPSSASLFHLNPAKNYLQVQKKHMNGCLFHSFIHSISSIVELQLLCWVLACLFHSFFFSFFLLFISFSFFLMAFLRRRNVCWRKFNSSSSSPLLEIKITAKFASYPLVMIVGAGACRFSPH